MKTFLLLESQIVSLVKSIGLSRKFLWGTIIIRYDFYEVSEWRMGLNSGCLKVRRSEWCFLGPDPWIRVAGSPWFPTSGNSPPPRGCCPERPRTCSGGPSRPFSLGVLRQWVLTPMPMYGNVMEVYIICVSYAMFLSEKPMFHQWI